MKVPIYKSIPSGTTIISAQYGKKHVRGESERAAAERELCLNCKKPCNFTETTLKRCMRAAGYES